MNDDAVFQRGDGLWHFWDEHGKYFYGPYATEDEARDALAEYLKNLG